MHTTEFTYTSKDKLYSNDERIDAGTEVTVYFHYNSDLSGEVIVSTMIGSKVLGEMNIPGWMLVEFVGRHFRIEMISKLEQMSGTDTLKLLLP